MNKAIHIGLSAIVALILAVVIVKPEVADSVVLLESKHPSYVKAINERNNRYVDDENGSYVLTSSVVKDGFGSFSPSDLDFYLKHLRTMYPELTRASLCFTDGTGVEIDVDDTEENVARYGLIDEAGLVGDDGIIIDIHRPLINQIPGLTVIDREYDERGNIAYQFRKGADGKGIVDQRGIAGFIKVYDKSGNTFWKRNDNVISEVYLGDEGTVVNCKYGYAKVRREYDGRKLLSEAYYDYEGNLVNRTDFGCASIKYDYNDADSYLTYCYDANGQLLKMGEFIFP